MMKATYKERLNATPEARQLLENHNSLLKYYDLPQLNAEEFINTLFQGKIKTKTLTEKILVRLRHINIDLIGRGFKIVDLNRAWKELGVDWKHIKELK